MPYELFIALRYLRARRRQKAVSVITAIAIAGIALGVASLIVAQALIYGFRRDVQNKILQGTAHINLLRTDNSGIENYRDLIKRIREVPGINDVSATIYAPVLMTFGDRQEQAVLKGIDPESKTETADVLSSVIEGDPKRFLSDPADRPASNQDGPAEIPDGILIGKQLARTLGVKIDDILTAVSANLRLTPTGLQPRPRYTRLRVAGIFSSGLYEYDARWAYIPLFPAQRMTGVERSAGVIQIKVEDIDSVEALGEKIRSIAGPDFMTTNWQELNRPLFAALKLQHRVVIIFFALLIMIAALNIITALTMMVIEKHRDIAILRAQGATPRNIRRIFNLQGLIIGFIGAGLGLMLGIATAWTANRFQLVSIPAEIYSISFVTLQVRAIDCLLIASLGIAICFLATLYPSILASRLTPVEALRYE